MCLGLCSTHFSFMRLSVFFRFAWFVFVMLWTKAIAAFGLCFTIFDVLNLKLLTCSCCLSCHVYKVTCFWFSAFSSILGTPRIMGIHLSQFCKCISACNVCINTCRFVVVVTCSHKTVEANLQTSLSQTHTIVQDHDSTFYFCLQ